jgi:putative ABC transport system permease protein
MLDRALLPGGSYLGQPGSAILGAKLAEDLGLKVGDTLKVVSEKADYGMGFKKFRIAGLFRTGVDIFDASTFQVGLADARQLLGLGNGASQILVMLRDYRDSDAAARLISAHLASVGMERLSVQSWTSLGDIAALIALSGRIYLWAEIVVAFLGAFIIANIMMMVVLERRREIGILKSMGMERPRILRLFLVEGVLLGIIGSAVGAVLGTALNAWLSVKGLDFTASISGSGIAMDNVIYTGVRPLHVALLFLLGVAVSAVVSFLPSRGAARMNAIEAIRSV